MCNNIDVPYMEGKVDEKGEKMEEIQLVICPIQKDEIPYDMNEEKSELKKNEMSRNVYKKVKCFDTFCEESGNASLVDGLIMLIARPDAYIATVVDCLTEKRYKQAITRSYIWISMESNGRWRLSSR